MGKILFQVQWCVHVIGQEVVEIEYQAIRKIYKRINNSFAESVKLILHCNSRLIIVGIGKSAIIAKKLVATFNSTGQPAIFLHAAEAIHGDLGSIQKLCLKKFMQLFGHS